MTGDVFCSPIGVCRIKRLLGHNPFLKSIGQPLYVKNSLLENKGQPGKAFVIDGYERQDYSDLAGYVKFVPL